jgi:hypothetical protein
MEKSCIAALGLTEIEVGDVTRDLHRGRTENGVQRKSQGKPSSTAPRALGIVPSTGY